VTDNLVYFDGITRLDMPPEKVLHAALDADMEGVVVIGWQEGEFYAASSIADGGEVLWLLEKLKQHLLDAHENA